MTEIITYEAEHGLSIIRDQTRDIESWFTTAKNARALMIEKANGAAWTLLDDGVPVACAGFYRFLDRGAEAWFMMSPKAKRHIAGLMKIIRNGIDTFLEETDFTLLVAHILKTDDAGHAWAKYMGFTPTQFEVLDKGHLYVVYSRGDVE